MQILQAEIEDYVLGEYTTFSLDEESGQTILSVTDPTGFSANKYVVLGVIGNENSEICQVASTSTNSITVAVATTKKHYKDEPIQVIRYNQRKFYRSTTETGTFSHLSGEGSPVAIKIDNPQGTILEDTTGTTTSWYKATYYNSYSLSETSLDDAVAVQAGDADHYVSLYKILAEAGLQNNPYLSTEIVDRYRNEAEEETEGSLITKYSLPLPKTSRILQKIIILSAAGNLLSQEYGVEANIEISKSGERKIKRAEELIDRILEGKITLIDTDGSELSKQGTSTVRCSNTYDGETSDLGEMFNIGEEQFKMTDFGEPTADSYRKADSTVSGF